MNRAEQYLAIPEEYCGPLGGFRWAGRYEAVESLAEVPEIGCTFALGPEIALFLEGFVSTRELVSFGFVLHTLYFLGFGVDRRRPSRPRPIEALATAFHDLRRPLRNAGALVGMLCRDVPRVPDPPEFSDVAALLNARNSDPFSTVWASTATVESEIPPLEPAEFEQRVAKALTPLSSEAIRHWLCYGRGPVGAVGERVAGTVPRTLGTVLDALQKRPRLAEAAAVVAWLDGALDLPRRRLDSAGLPTGGYSDVATRGRPEQILPAQLVLDGDEFVRRFAERELLYFHREEPKDPRAEQLVVLLDQGVRTWGDVRLVLASALLALGRQAARRGLPFRVAATSEGGAVHDPLELDDEGVGSLLEASDLTIHPAPALETVLADPVEGPRDVVLLTHPRCLAERVVVSAALKAGPGTRLFAISVDGSGEVELSELRRGTPVVRSRCRIRVRDRDGRSAVPGDLGASEAPWSGDVEFPGFPFPLGALSPIQDRLFDFDESGERLLLGGEHGLLHCWKVDGSGSEMLPRALVNGVPLASIQAVLGVAGGFVVAGRVARSIVAVHYDFRSRACTVHEIELPAHRNPEWSYSRLLHAVVAREGDVALLAVDLAVAGAQARTRGGSNATPGAIRAVRAFREDSGFSSFVAHDDESLPERGRALRLHTASGAVDIRDDQGICVTTTPFSDGEPALKGGRILQARAGGNLIGAVIGDSFKTTLFLFSVTTFREVEQYPLPHDSRGFALSRDGRRLARRVGYRHHIEVRDVSGAVAPLFVTPRGKAHNHLEVELGATFLLVDTGRYLHFIRWDRGRLEFSVRREAPDEFLTQEGILSTRVRSTRRSDSLPHDSRRFPWSCSLAGLTVLVDFVGQLAVFDSSGQLLCMLIAFRDRLAAWMPDGTRLGPESMVGGRSSPNAAERIGEVLLRGLPVVRRSST